MIQYGAMQHHHWNSVKKEELSPLISRQMINTRQMTVARIGLKKGAVVPMHSHVSEQLSTLESGSMRFVVGGQETILRPGEALEIPSQVPHMAEALEDTLAIDMFSPPREDWIRGDDAYLRNPVQK
jgi:quercetin dioxygenase-like cupin family protein